MLRVHIYITHVCLLGGLTITIFYVIQNNKRNTLSKLNILVLRGSIMKLNTVHDYNIKVTVVAFTLH